MSQVASSDEGFGATPTDAAYHYHSVYDSQRFQELYADPGFHRHVCRRVIIFASNDLNGYRRPLRSTWVYWRCVSSIRLWFPSIHRNTPLS